VFVVLILQRWLKYRELLLELSSGNHSGIKTETTQYLFPCVVLSPDECEKYRFIIQLVEYLPNTKLDHRSSEYDGKSMSHAFHGLVIR